MDIVHCTRHCIEKQRKTLSLGLWVGAWAQDLVYDRLSKPSSPHELSHKVESIARSRHLIPKKLNMHRLDRALESDHHAYGFACIFRLRESAGVALKENSHSEPIHHSLNRLFQ